MNTTHLTTPANIIDTFTGDSERTIDDLVAAIWNADLGDNLDEITTALNLSFDEIDFIDDALDARFQAHAAAAHPVGFDSADEVF